MIVDQEQTVEKLELVWHHQCIEMMERGKLQQPEGKQGRGLGICHHFESQCVAQVIHHPRVRTWAAFHLLFITSFPLCCWLCIRLYPLHLHVYYPGLVNCFYHFQTIHEYCKVWMHWTIFEFWESGSILQMKTTCRSRARWAIYYVINNYHFTWLLCYFLRRPWPTATRQKH